VAERLQPRGRSSATHGVRGAGAAPTARPPGAALQGQRRPGHAVSVSVAQAQASASAAAAAAAAAGHTAKGGGHGSGVLSWLMAENLVASVGGLVSVYPVPVVNALVDAIETGTMVEVWLPG
jgi:hypothetical protein